MHGKISLADIRLFEKLNANFCLITCNSVFVTIYNTCLFYPTLLCDEKLGGANCFLLDQQNGGSKCYNYFILYG